MSPWSDWNDIALNLPASQGRSRTAQSVSQHHAWAKAGSCATAAAVPEKLHERREHYNAEVPSGVLVLTMGVDTQDNRLEYEVVGWSREEESWGISRGIIPGRPDSPAVWEEIDNLLDREWRMKNGMKMRILATFVDSGGHFTQEVYKECAKREGKRVWAVKGDGGEGKPYVRQMKTSARNADSAKLMIGVDAGKAAIMHATTVGSWSAPGTQLPHGLPLRLRYECSVAFVPRRW